MLLTGFSAFSHLFYRRITQKWLQLSSQSFLSINGSSFINSFWLSWTTSNPKFLDWMICLVFSSRSKLLCATKTTPTTILMYSNKKKRNLLIRTLIWWVLRAQSKKILLNQFRKRRHRVKLQEVLKRFLKKEHSWLEWKIC
jgi:hypothetical protein